jgi:hypothetical protein
MGEETWQRFDDHTKVLNLPNGVLICTHACNRCDDMYGFSLTNVGVTNTFVPDLIFVKGVFWIKEKYYDYCEEIMKHQQKEEDNVR